jgi:hypothetical protein
MNDCFSEPSKTDRIITDISVVSLHTSPDHGISVDFSSGDKRAIIFPKLTSEGLMIGERKIIMIIHLFV